MKLTNPQRELLNSLPTHAVRGYKPADRLIELGLAFRASDGQLGSGQLKLTPAGQKERDKNTGGEK